MVISDVLPTVTSVMWHPNPDLRLRWRKQYNKDRFSFEDARTAQSFPYYWIFPKQKTRKWKWIAEAFPPKVSLYLLDRHVSGSGNILLDLFAGIGGWSLGAYHTGKFRKIIMVEKDQSKCQYLNLNFSKLDIDYEIVCDDVRNITYNFYFDIAVASPPCEDLTMLRYLSNNNINVGTISLTLFTLDFAREYEPEIAFYENVYRLSLRKLLEDAGWNAVRFDMSKVIPQKRVRLIGVKYGNGYI